MQAPRTMRDRRGAYVEQRSRRSEEAHVLVVVAKRLGAEAVIEFILRARATAERLAVAELLEVVQAAGDASVAVHAVRIERDRGAPVAARVELGRVEDGLEVS